MKRMSRYVKETPRINIKFIDSDTEETLFEVKDRNPTNVGDIFSDYITSSLIKDEHKNKRLPKNVMVIAVAEFKLVDD